MTIVQSHGFNYTAACLQMLCFECRLAYSQMNDVRVCIILTWEYPETIEFNVGQSGVTCAAATIPQAVVASNANKSSVNNNLKMLMLIPKNDAGVPLMKGKKLFDHMSHFEMFNMQQQREKEKTNPNYSVGTQQLPFSSSMCVFLASGSEVGSCEA